MNIVNGTPPAGYPEQVVVAQDSAFAARHPKAAYWLRVSLREGGVRAVQLPGAIGPHHAHRIARDLGFAPTHFTDPGDGRPWLL